MTITDILMLSLATWRISSLLANEEGPLGIFEHLRHRLGVRYNEYSERTGSNVVARAIMCLWCISVYVALGWVIAFSFSPTVTTWIALPFALSAAAIVIDRIV